MTTHDDEQQLEPETVPEAGNGEGAHEGSSDGDGMSEQRTEWARSDEDVPPRLLSIVESLLFASEKPLKASQIQKLLGERSPARLRRVLSALVERRADAGITVVEVDGGYQLRTNPENARWVRRLEEVKPVRMSRASLEVVAVVAYRQPVTRAEIDQIRGVDSGGALKLLLSRDLVRILGRKEEPGRPFLYGTTHEFLSFFSLASLSELPPLRDVAELAATQAEDDDPETEAEGADAAAQAPARPEVPPEITPEEIAADDEDFDELDEGDDEVLEALEDASNAARGADRVRRTLKKMARTEAAAGPSSPEAGRMLESIEELVATRYSRKKKAEAEAAAAAAAEAAAADGDAPADPAPPGDGAASPDASPESSPPTAESPADPSSA